MSVDVQTSPPAPSAAPAGRGTWSLSWHGLRTVTVLELRQRVRSTRWKTALVVWFLVVGLITLLTTGAFAILSGDGMADEPFGGIVYSIVVGFVLFLGLLVAPTLSSGAINGDRNAGTLATLQVTLLTPAEIVLGKLAAAWIAALAFLVASIPFLAWALAGGGVSWLALLTTVLMLAVVLGVVCAIGLGFSALVGKTSGSAVLTYLTIGGLTAVLPIVFGLLVPVTTSTEEVRVWDVEPGYTWEETTAPECEWQTHEADVWHSERTWWLLAPNPFVVVADAQPLGGDPETLADDGNMLALLQYGVRYARTGDNGEQDWCSYMVGSGTDSPVEPVVVTDQLVWPWGLGFDLLLGAGGVVVAVNRLRVPTTHLPQGTRVA
ncbi:ABC transporter permease [Promicromonospora thailandica]|uniref:ABC-type transport system involved in multi-copper enzyme maturation, permease component n=1 Tax=Promicromonospora thailandica TaxID=765201 RepID=A0A9X2JXM2_9MICO|nr:ABC transporter permease subunit [Promicromonospora thailandica]MCP2266373.1 ABC-type transport system involved in multi-copper enzyme maturation, permease component [Promicromonospora thailandica]BFF20051.1 ABC transporter permease subunit [Promicromonospora thailandica]